MKSNKKLSALRLLILFKSIRFGAAAIAIIYLALSLASFSSPSLFTPTYLQVLCIIALVIVMIYSRGRIEEIARKAELKEADLDFLKLLKNYNSRTVEKAPSEIKGSKIKRHLHIERALKIIDFILLVTFCVSFFSYSVAGFVYEIGALISIFYISLVVVALILKLILNRIDSNKTFQNVILVFYIFMRSAHSIIQLYIICLLIEFLGYFGGYWPLSNEAIQIMPPMAFIAYIATLFIRSRICSIEASLGISVIDVTKIFYPLLLIRYDLVSNSKEERRTAKEKSEFFVESLGFEFFYDLLKMIAVVAIPILMFYILQQYGIAESAATYIGLPWLLAILLALSPKAKTASGLAFKGTTMVLLLGAPIFGAGYICIFFMFPLFYWIGYIIAKPIFDARNGKGKFKAAFISVIVGFMALEGTTEFTSFPREHEVEVSKVVAGSLADVRATLAQTPTLDNNRSFLLKIFPNPVEVSGSGLKVGDTRKFKFIAYKHIFWTKLEGETVMEITESSPTRIKSVVTKDDSYIDHYIKWNGVEIVLDPIDDKNTKVTWKLSFHRIYDPYWYFGTLQEYAAKLAAEEMIDHAATPRV